MQLKYFQIDTFTNSLFSGNPAGVCLLSGKISDDLMLKISKENNLAETAFVIENGENYDIKWFTPEIEMDLCGHATLAAAFVIYNFVNKSKSITFNSKSGLLNIEIDNNKITMDFPRREPINCEAPESILKSLNILPIEVLKARDYIFVYPNEQNIRDIKINLVEFNKINLDPGGICVTSIGKDVDFVSRYFTPQSSILEDPVTGSSHCSLIPYWAKKLGKNKLQAKQISEREGYLFCENLEDRVKISGFAVLYNEGKINLTTYST